MRFIVMTVIKLRIGGIVKIFIEIKILEFDLNDIPNLNGV